jgi:hypothetical protein
MQVDIATFCEHAKVRDGSMSLAGTFDQINTRILPFVVHPFYVALRFRFAMHEAGRHTITLRLEDGDKQPLAKSSSQSADLTYVAGAPWGVFGLTFQLAKLRFDRAGVFACQVDFDGVQVASLPFAITKI